LKLIKNYSNIFIDSYNSYKISPENFLFCNVLYGEKISLFKYLNRSQILEKGDINLIQKSTLLIFTNKSLYYRCINSIINYVLLISDTRNMFELITSRFIENSKTVFECYRDLNPKDSKFEHVKLFKKILSLRLGKEIREIIRKSIESHDIA